MTLNADHWAKMDRIGELDAKEQVRLRNQQYYRQNSASVRKRIHNNYKKRREEIASSLGGSCRFCGESDLSLLNFHHTVPMEVKGSKIYHYMANMDILCLLCVKCHTTYHIIMDELRIDDIFKEKISGNESFYEIVGREF